MNDQLIEKITSRGYYRINFQPLVYKTKLETLALCKEAVEKNSVQLRGWDYPHFPRRTGDDTGLEPCGEYYQGWIDWDTHKEFWRMYKSGQFLHYVALREDWLEESRLSALAPKIKPLSVLGITGSVVYQLTEIFEFLARLTRSGLYDEGVRVNIGLYNLKNRSLWVDALNRVPLSSPHITGAEKLTFQKEFTKEEILLQSKEIALSFILSILDAFGWETPPIDTIRKDQEKLLAGRI